MVIGILKIIKLFNFVGTLVKLRHRAKAEEDTLIKMASVKERNVSLVSNVIRFSNASLVIHKT